MDDEELEGRKSRVEKPDFESYSVNDLNEYIADLEAEIERAKTAIAKKGDARSVADSFFN